MNKDIWQGKIHYFLYPVPPSLLLGDYWYYCQRSLLEESNGKRHRKTRLGLYQTIIVSPYNTSHLVQTHSSKIITFDMLIL